VQHLGGWLALHAITVTFTPGDVGTSPAKVAVNDDSNNDRRQYIYLALANSRPGSAPSRGLVISTAVSKADDVHGELAENCE
jgi:hypothetical protein